MIQTSARVFEGSASHQRGVRVNPDTIYFLQTLALTSRVGTFVAA